MAEPDKQYSGDGSDNYAQGAQKAAEAAKKIGQATAEKATAAGAEATANAAAATVQAGVEGGKAVSEIAAGTAAGGPWGAIISAAWALRHTLFKILVCICLILTFFIVAIISLPSIIFNNIFHTDPGTVDPGGLTDPWAIYEELGTLVGEKVNEGHDYALKEAERLIQRGGYDYEFSMEALIDYGISSTDYDVCYILAAYSAAMEQRGTTKIDLLGKLDAVKDEMFPITYEEKKKERIIPLTYPTYSATSVTVITGKNPYTTGSRTYYHETGSKTTTESVDVTDYQPVEVEVPVYTDGRITGTSKETYYEANGTKTLTPDTEMVKYLEITIHPFDSEVIIKAFGINMDAPYNQFNITYREAIDFMAEALRRTLGLGPGMIAPGDVIGTGEYIWPVPASSRITSYYGERIHPITHKKDFHLGIDIGAPLGTPIVAADGGTVISTSVHYSYGIHCLIDHGNGTRTLYAHMSSMNVAVGSGVEQGEEIGKVGHTDVADGDHLHFETHVGANRVDPRTYFPGV